MLLLHFSKRMECDNIRPFFASVFIFLTDGCRCDQLCVRWRDFQPHFAHEALTMNGMDGLQKCCFRFPSLFDAIAQCTWITLITAKVLTGLKKKIVFLFCTTLCAERIAWNKMSVAAHIITKKTSNTRMALWWENRSAFNVLPRLCIFHSVYRSGCIDRNVRYMFSSDLNALLQTICSNYSAQHQRVMRNVNIIPLAPSHYNRFWAASPLYPYAEYWCWYTLNCGGT